MILILDILTPYKILMTRLQTQNRPIAHRVVPSPVDPRFFRGMNTKFLGDSATWGKHYRACVVANNDTDNMMYAMENQI